MYIVKTKYIIKDKFVQNLMEGKKLTRSKTERQTKIVFTKTLKWKGPSSRQRRRWRDRVEKDLQKLGISNWIERIRDRAE